MFTPEVYASELLLSSFPLKDVCPAVAVYSNAVNAPVDETEPKDNTALPFVCNTCPFEPSEVGRLNAVPPEVIITLLPSEAILSFESCNCNVGVPPLSVKSNPVS